MKYPNLVPQDEPTPEPVEVDPRDAEIERLHAERDSQLKAQAAADARLEMMERQLAGQYQDRTAAPTAPAPSPSYEAQQELGITDEELIARPAESMRTIAEHVATKMNAESMQRVGQVVGNLANSTYEMELKDLAAHPYYEHLEGQLRQHFNNNAQEYTSNPGAVRKKFNELIGQNLAELQRLQAETEANATEATISQSTNAAPATRSRTRAVEPSITVETPSPGARPVDKTSGKTALDPSREELRQTFNAFGLNMSEEEWVEIEEGRALPKKVSADIQLGINKPNVDY